MIYNSDKLIYSVCLNKPGTHVELYVLLLIIKVIIIIIVVLLLY